MSYAIRRTVYDDLKLPERERKLSPGALAALSAPKASKHYIPRSLRRELQIAPQVFRHHRSPKNAALAGPYVPGCLRLSSDGSRRLYAGERWSMDDGSQNQVVVVPWPQGGDPESDRFGHRTCRGQWLVVHDDATSKIVAWTFTLRPRDAYRDPDAMGLVYRAARDVCRPDECVCEGGVWQSRRALAFYRAAGIKVIDARGRPHQKLIENWWNRAWTDLSRHPNGQIGRKRGEYQRENDLLVKCHRGSLDGSSYFPSVTDLFREFDECCDFYDHSPVESKLYGKWIPQERWDADMAAHPRPPISTDLAPFAAPESRVLTAKRGGMVDCKVTCPLGIPVIYSFAHEALEAYEGQKVRVIFDPFEEVIRAVVVADRTTALSQAGDLICTAPCMNPPPLPIASEGWAVALERGGPAAAAAVKKAIGNASRTEYRALGSGGRRRVRMSETRGPDGVERIEISGGVAGSCPAAVATGRGDSPRPASVDFTRRVAAAEREMPEPARRRLKTFAELAEA